MMFRPKGSHTYKVRVDTVDGRRATLTTGCVTKADAEDVERAVHRWQGRKGKKYARPDVIDALVEKRIALPDAFEADTNGTLDALVAAHPPTPVAVDLMPLLEAWRDDKRKSGKGAGQADVYYEQILRLMPARPLTLAMFNRKDVWALLDALDVDAPTKNRYRSAASSLASFLVKRELLDRNFVREITGYGENDPRLVYYEIDDARRLIGGLQQPYAGIAAAALGFCMEWCALDTLRVGDVALEADPITSRVRGTKRRHRNRIVPLVPQLAWTLDYIRPLLADKTPTALVFDAVPEWRAIDVIRDTADELEIAAVGEEEFGPHSLHDWRQTHAVALLRWGYNEQIVADHLGHKNTTLVRNNYGRFKPTAHDYAKAKPEGESSTDLATPRKRHMKRGGVR